MKKIKFLPKTTLGKWPGFWCLINFVYPTEPDIVNSRVGIPKMSDEC